MSSKEPRVGIERKILTSIMWVGILPMTVALIVAYITARGGQSNATRQTLSTAAGKTAEGLSLLVATRLNTAARLAEDPDVIATLKATGEGRARSPDDLDELIRRLDNFGINPSDGPSIVSLYDLEGRLVVSTNHELAFPTLQPSWRTTEAEPVFTSLGLSAQTQALGSTIVSHVIDSASARLLGYLAISSRIESLFRYGMGKLDDAGAPTTATTVYQLAYLARTAEGSPAAFTVNLDESANNASGLRAVPMDSTLRDALAPRPPSGSLLVNNYRAFGENGPAHDVILAFERVQSPGRRDMDVYVVVFRPLGEVFSSLYVGAGAAAAGCIFFIAFLCFNAYRDVHNNIVRPVLLLNEGAQIIRQGDFDLKLKIGTGDEIEELASSFNKMAVALKRNIRQLEESEEKYRSLVTSMRDGIYQTDVNGAITFLNPRGVEILGFPSPEEALGVNFADLFIDPVDFNPSRAETSPPDWADRSRVWMKQWDGRTICVEISRNVVRSETGEPVGMEGNFRDVTRNVKLEEEARERSERIAAINQIANVINSNLEAGRLYESLVVELKKLVQFDYASVALRSDRGPGFDGRQLWPDHEVKPGYTFTLDAETSSAAWVAKERRCLVVNDLRRPGSPYTMEFPEPVASCLCVPLYATGRIIGTLNLGNNQPAAFSRHDIEVLEQMAPHLAVAIRNAQLLLNLQLSLEEVSRAREKLREANEELKTLDEMKTNLLSNVSHELRTPLVSVMGYTDMILNGKAGAINNTQREYLEISLRNVEKLVTLIENLLDFSRLHRGDERLVFDTFDLVDCARNSIQIVQPVADGRDIRVYLDAPEGPILVEGDKGKMGQVFNNLLSNAVKFNYNGGEVRVEMKLGEGWVEISIADTGIGIPTEALDKVFTRFYQYDSSSTRKYGGTGIGLSIAQDIVRLHGSSITVTSEVGRGSVFRFRLALTSAKRTTSGTTDELPAPEETHLLVELVTLDRALSVQVRHLLATENMDMIHASSAENAITLAQKHSPDCILVDLNVAGEDEAALEEMLKDEYVSILPILVLTNDDKLYERYRGRVSARVKRSFRKSSLLSGIHHALSQRHHEAKPLGEKVLCVDDDPEVLTFMARCLTTEGFAVDQCKSGEEALQRVRCREYGLVLLDIAMPGMDGWETCRKIKADPELAAMKIYMVTAKPIEQNKSLLQECGADGFLLKPFRAEDLAQLVHGLDIRAVAAN